MVGKAARITGDIACYFVSAVALTVLCGWVLSIPAIVQVRPDFAPMQFNTALCFFLLAVSSLGQCTLCRTTAFLCFALATLSGFQYISGADYGIDTLFVLPDVVTKTSHPGRMAPNTALMFSVLALARMLLISTRPGRKRVVAALILTSIGIFLSVSAGIGYFASFEIAYGWFHLTRMAIHTSLCGVILSLRLYFWGTEELYYKKTVGKVLTPLSVLILFIGTSLFLWNLVLRYETAVIREKLKIDAHIQVRAIQSEFREVLARLKSVERLFVASEYVNAEEFKTFVEPFISERRSILAIDWSPRVLEKDKEAAEREIARFSKKGLQQLDKNRKLTAHRGAKVYFPVTYTYPEAFPEMAFGFDHYSDALRARVMDDAAQNDTITMTEPFQLFRSPMVGPSKLDLLVLVPVFDTTSDSTVKPARAAQMSNLRGFVIGVIRLSHLVEKVLEDLALHGINMTFESQFDSGEWATVYNRNYQEYIGYDRDSLFSQIVGYSDELVEKINVAGRKFRIHYMPTGKYIMKHHTAFPSTVFLVSCFMSIFVVAWILYLSSKNEILTHATDARARFLANVSHEIRTPINGVMGMAALLEETELDMEQQVMLNAIHYSAESLLALVNDILDYSKIEADKFELDPVPFQLREHLLYIEKIFNDKISEKQIDYTLEVSDDVPDRLIGDPARLRQILLNLISNALKFTPKEGRVALSISRISQGDKELTLRFAISDSGIGIPKEKQKTIFDVFSQADQSTSRIYGGTGLGLAISTRLVEMMHGEISVESEPGEGSTFTFTATFLPQIDDVQIPEQTTVKKSADDAPQHFRILLAEDNAVNQTIALRMLEKAGHMVTVASNGQQALEAFESEEFDVVLMDIQMPILDGVEASRRIRLSEKGRAVPIVALTAHVIKSETDKYIEEGQMDCCLVKPYKKEELLELLKDVTLTKRA